MKPSHLCLMKGRWLNPLVDPVFKRIFGEQKKLMISFINAAINLTDPVVDIEYLQPELVSQYAFDKGTIVDVRCRDANKRHFIVEMQVVSQAYFSQRVLFNTAKVYSRQLSSGEQYHLLQPVYCLCLLDHLFEPDLPNWLHLYELRHVEYSDKRIEGIHLMFMELPKFRKLGKFDMENPLHLWMKFFVEPEYFKNMPAKKYETFEELKQAIEMLHESNFTEEQLWAYDRYLDGIRSQYAIEQYRKESLEKALKDGLEQGIAQGMEKGLEKGMEKGMEKGKEAGIELTLEIIRQLNAGKLSIDEIALNYGMSRENILHIKESIS